MGATDTKDTADPADDTVADFSSRDAVRPPDVLAPGVKMVSLRVPGSTLDEEFPAARIGGALLPRQRHVAGHRRSSAGSPRGCSRPGPISSPTR